MGAFVKEGSVPPGVIIKDPRNMQHDTVLAVLAHWYERQVTSGPESAFAFQLVMGPKRKRLFAEYPPKNATRHPSQQSKKKGKAKKVQQLDHLLAISDVGTLGPSATPIQDPRPNVGLDISHVTGNDPRHSPGDMVRIDMGQMADLRKMGHHVPGPVNGPNEGQTQYEVPRFWLEQLQATSMPTSAPAPGPSPTMPRPYPRPRPIFKTPAAPLIDPALIVDLPVENTPPTNPVQPNVVPNEDAGPSGASIKESTVLGKRNPLLRSPPSKRQTRSSQKCKIITGDDLALQEAQKLLKGGVTTRKTRKRK
jgi:hypothetical protein